MTRFYEPKQRLRDGRWDMTSYTGSTNPSPVGYCRPYEPICAEGHFVSKEVAEHINTKHAPYQHKFHEDGHATAAEAMACWVEHQLDLELEFRDHMTEQHHCEYPGCHKWTQRTARLGRDVPEIWWVCPAHDNRASIEHLAKDLP